MPLKAADNGGAMPAHGTGQAKPEPVTMAPAYSGRFTVSAPRIWPSL